MFRYDLQEKKASHHMLREMLVKLRTEIKQKWEDIIRFQRQIHDAVIERKA